MPFPCRSLKWLVRLVSFALLPGCAGIPAPTDPLADAGQLLLVRAHDWDSPHGVLRRYERHNDAWLAAGPPVPVTLGRHGLGWGRGIAAAPQNQEPIKREGDGRAPAGVFHLQSLFGYALPSDPAVHTLRLPYRPATATLECVDDSRSGHYNTLIDRTQINRPDWTSSESLLRPDELYRWGIVVGHNPPPARPGAGSCIFLHRWAAPDIPTSGCTAMAAESLQDLLPWLDPAKHPLLVQLPEAAYIRLKADWKLP